MARLAPTIDTLSSIGEGGARNFLHPADVGGRFTRLRRVIFAVLIAVLVVMPFITINGHPGILLDIGHRSFHIVGATFGPTQGYLLFFLITGTGFALVVASALWGRVWCGYACPQTVFLEGVYRRIERLFEGDRSGQLKLNQSPWDGNKIARRGGKWLVFLALSAFLAHLLLCYFVPPASLWQMMGKGPKADPEVFAWAAALTGAIFFNFAWFREQFCIILCPYGRLQSVLSDDDTVVVGYDAVRGEPRGKAGTSTGDCVDCLRCINVCPTGIDIRQGMQLECVGCANCIDACDEVMLKLKRPTGLVRYDSEHGLRHQPKRFLRPRVYIYAVLGVLGLVALTATSRSRPDLPINLLRQPGMPYVLDEGQIRNGFMLRTNNKFDSEQTYEVEIKAHNPKATVTLPENKWRIPVGEQSVLPFFVVLPREGFTGRFDVEVEIESKGGAEVKLHVPFLGPD